MKQITKESIAAFMKGEYFRKANMEVRVIATEKGVPCVFHLKLHGNTIAIRHTNARTEKLQITNCGWKSNTTKERLNALPGVSIYQKNWEWYLNDKEWDGTLTEIK